MKLIAEKRGTDASKPWHIFVEDDQGKHPVDLSIHSIFLTPAIGGEVELRILRPSGILDRLFGEHKRLYLRIKSSYKGVKRWLWSDDQGHSWGPVKKMSSSSAETIDALTIQL